MMTPDGKAIIFSSDRPGAIGSFVEKSSLYHGDYWGNIDLYVCLKNDSGWSEPINLGPKINTPYAERTPFLHPDNKTLYFSSDGHYGLGRLDVFVTTRLKDDSWTEWSDPINLGKDINTPGQDYCFKISTSGETGYLAASNKKEGLGGSDIFTMSPLPAALRPKPVVTISGKVTDKNMHPLAADIKWESLTTGETVGQLRSDPKTGDYFIVLALGHNYGYYAEKKDYYPTSFNIDLQNETQSQHRIINIILYGMDTILQISNVFFESGRAKLKQESFPELNRLAKIVKANPDKKLEIAGHTDSLGSFDMNMRLSKERAQAVVDYLILVGCPQDYFTAIAFGPTKPVTTNKTPEGRQRNRRVEFRFIKQ
jgi:outer membrane protein OmpA-like peptidoglycan-associated protein